MYFSSRHFLLALSLGGTFFLPPSSVFAMESESKEETQHLTPFQRFQSDYLNTRRNQDWQGLGERVATLYDPEAERIHRALMAVRDQSFSQTHAQNTHKIIEALRAHKKWEAPTNDTDYLEKVKENEQWFQMATHTSPPQKIETFDDFRHHYLHSNTPHDLGKKLVADLPNPALERAQQALAVIRDETPPDHKSHAILDTLEWEKDAKTLSPETRHKFAQAHIDLTPQTIRDLFQKTGLAYDEQSPFDTNLNILLEQAQQNAQHIFYLYKSM